MNLKRYLAVAIAAASIGCGDDSPTSPPPSPPITRLFIFARNWPTEEVELFLTREEGRSTIVLFIPEREDHPRIVLDSIGPIAEEPQQITDMLASFDVWALNAPNAPGAACRTSDGQRVCYPTFEDYSLVMRVESGDQVRVQRYTGLEKSTGNATARALGDFVLAWAREYQ